MDATQKIINDNPDSVTIGTPGKGGEVKVYGDYSKPAEFKAKIDAAMEIRKYAAEKIGVV